MNVRTARRSWSRTVSFLVSYGGLLYTLFILHVIAYVGLFVACPAVHDEGHCSGKMTVFAVVVMLQLYVNLFFFQYYSRENNVSYWQRHSVVADLCRSSSLEEDLHGPNVIGKHCVDCNRPAPLRSHHCPLCDLCVLRKDHHCFIVGSCVGLGNQRYFIVFLFWSIIGSVAGSIYIAEYMNHEVAAWFPTGFLNWVGPVAACRWLLGYETLFNATITIILSFSVASALSALGFFGSQIFYTLHGYTMYEWHCLSITTAFDGDGENIGERMRLVFGPYYLLNFFFPLFWQKQRLTPEIADNLFRVRSKLL